MLLEEIKSIKSTRRDLRKFGLTVGIFLLIIAGFLFWKQRPSFPYFAYAGGALALAALIAPFLLKPVYKIWMSFAVVMGFIMTRMILTLLYYGLFTPTALVTKLLGKDLLEQDWDRKAASYWVKRPVAPFDSKSAENMF
jgi:hypothetical protein